MNTQYVHKGKDLNITLTFQETLEAITDRRLCSPASLRRYLKKLRIKPVGSMRTNPRRYPLDTPVKVLDALGEKAVTMTQLRAVRRQAQKVKGAVHLGLVLLLWALVTGGAMAEAPQFGTFFLKSRATNQPPLPCNPKPGYPVVSLGGTKYLVDDTITDAQVLSQALTLMETESGGPLPPPPYPGWEPPTNTVVPPPDTNGWMGTFVRGLPCPRNSEGLPVSQEPALWTIVCTNAGYSQFPHQMNPWLSSWTKVCSRDRVYVLWPHATASLTGGWGCLLVQQRGTNEYGPWTNTVLRTMGTVNGGGGNWAMFEMPDYPTNAFYEPNNWGSACWTNKFTWECTNTWDGTNVVVTTNDTEWVFCLRVDGQSEADGGPSDYDPDQDPGGTPPDRLPKNPLVIANPPNQFPPHRPPDQNFPVVQPHPQGSCFSLPQDPPPLVWPPYFPPLWYYVPPGSYDAPAGGGGAGSYSPEEDGYWILEIVVHGLPCRTYAVESSTNLVNWAQEGTHGITLGAEGVASVTLGRDGADLPPSPFFWRLRYVQ